MWAFRRANWQSLQSVLCLALTVGTAQAQDKTFTMKITTPTLNAALDQYAKVLAAAIEKDSGGRIKVEVYPASQLGSIPRQIEGTQFGAIQCADYSAGIFRRHRRALRSACRARPGDVGRPGSQDRRRPGGAEILSRPRRRQGTARCRRCLRRTLGSPLKDRDPSCRRLQGQEDPNFCIRVPVGRLQDGWARPR